MSRVEKKVSAKPKGSMRGIQPYRWCTVSLNVWEKGSGGEEGREEKGQWERGQGDSEETENAP
jgi:hypothetical protein